MAKTWQQKYENGRKPLVETLDKDFSDMRKGQRMLISTPAELDAYIRAIPSGKTRSMFDLRTDLAYKHQADNSCPLTTGIFLRIISERALELLGGGASLTEITPFWRVVDPTGKLARKLSCGPDFIANLRSQEVTQA